MNRWPARGALVMILTMLAACATTPPASPPQPSSAPAAPEQQAPVAAQATQPSAETPEPTLEPAGEPTSEPAPATATPPVVGAPLEQGGGTGEPDAGQPASVPPLAGPQEPAVPDEEPSAPETAPETALETTRRSVRSTAEWLARGVDSWFGDKPFEQGGKVTDGRLSIGMQRRQGESLDAKVRLNARLRLPNVEERAYLFFGRDNDREIVSDTPAAFSRQDRLLADTAEDRAFFAGLGVALRKALELRIGFHGIKPYAQARYRKPWAPSERDLIEFRQTFFWRLEDHLGSTTALSYERAVSSTLAIRWLGASTITQKTDKFDWSSVLGTYKVYGGQRLLSLEAIATGSQHTGVILSEYGLQTKWLQPVYKDWLLGEFIVGHFWPRPDVTKQRTSVWAFGTSVTMRF